MKYKILLPILLFTAGCSTTATLPQATVVRHVVPEINMVRGGSASKLPATYDKFKDPSLVVFQNHSEGIATIIIDGKNSKKIVLLPRKASPDVYLEPGKHKIAVVIVITRRHYTAHLKQDREITIELKGYPQIIPIY